MDSVKVVSASVVDEVMRLDASTLLETMPGQSEQAFDVSGSLVVLSSLQEPGGSGDERDKREYTLR